MRIEGLFVIYPFGTVRLSTALVAAAILVVVTWRTGRPLRAALTVLAWISAFEIVWEVARLTFGLDSLRNVVWFGLAVLGWVLAAGTRGIRPDPRLTALFAVTFAIWLAAGFNSNWLGQSISIRDEVLNEVSKTALGLAYLLGALRADRPAPSEAHTVPT